MCQIGTEGLISAIDKYCGEYSKVYRSVIIGRCVGNLIENFSSTMLHFYPSDKRKLYRANKFKSKRLHGDYDTEDVVNEVNKTEGNKTDAEEIVGLMAAATMVSADAPPTTNDALDLDLHGGNISRYAAPEEARPDVQVETEEANFMMREAISKLSLFDRKLLRLKGLTFA